ncbi:hypothetical protein ACXYMU_10185 [Pontibacter sp. CAU 1760]
MKKTWILLALPALLWACSPDKKQEEDQAGMLETEVMAVHDEAMAKMGDLYKMRRSLRSLRDTLAVRQADSATLKTLQQQIDDLNQADEVMMGWMRNYQAPDSLQQKEAVLYLEQELKKVKRVKIVMDSTLGAAQTMYKNYEL